MPFIYRYTDKEDGITKYVGLVYGNSYGQLYQRLKQYQGDFNRLPKWCKLKNHTFDVFILEPSDVKTRGGC